MYCISVNHKTANAEIRRRLAFDTEGRRTLAEKICGVQGVRQCVVICTCNRFECYFGDESRCDEVLAEISRAAGFDDGEPQKYVMRFSGGSAVHHLFTAATGLDSMVVGEDEILRQIKEAYAESCEWGTADGDFNMIFQSAFACAKRIKTHTALSKTAVSIATLAANEAAKFTGKAANVLVIGASGKTGVTVVKNLLSHRNVSLCATLRRTLCAVPANGNVRYVDYAERYSQLDWADCVISATSSPHYTLTYSEISQSVKTTKPRLFIDLAVPPDIDSRISRLSGATLLNIDDFERLARQNNELKADSAQIASEMIKEDVDELEKELRFRKFLPYKDRIKTVLGENAAEKILYRLKADLNAQQFGAVLKSLENMSEECE